MFNKRKEARRALRDVVEQVDERQVTREVWVHLHTSLATVDGIDGLLDLELTPAELLHEHRGWE